MENTNTATTDLTTLTYADGIELRTARDGDEVIVCLADLARGLGIQNASQLGGRLPKGVCRTYTLQTAGGPQKMTFVTEAGMNMVIWRSDKPAAVAYARWCAERITELRRHGMTATNDAVEAMLADPDSMIRVLTALKEERAAKAALEAQAAQDAPYTLFGRAASRHDTDLLVKDVAALITQAGTPIGSGTLFRWLRKHGWLCKRLGRMWNHPTQWAIDKGYIRARIHFVSTASGDMERVTPQVTVAGQQALIEGWATGEFFDDLTGADK